MIRSYERPRATQSQIKSDVKFRHPLQYSTKLYGWRLALRRTRTSVQAEKTSIVATDRDASYSLLCLGAICERKRVVSIGR